MKNQYTDDTKTPSAFDQYVSKFIKGIASYDKVLHPITSRTKISENETIFRYEYLRHLVLDSQTFLPIGNIRIVYTHKNIQLYVLFSNTITE